MPSKTLLIVDDSRVSRMLIRTLVAKHRPGWALQEADSADAALKLLSAGPLPDFVTMDINMPGMLGTDAAERIAQAYPGRLRVALFSANIQGAHQALASTLGMAFVAKPVTDKSVLQAIAYFEEVT